MIAHWKRRLTVAGVAMASAAAFGAGCGEKDEPAVTTPSVPSVTTPTVPATPTTTTPATPTTPAP